MSLIEIITQSINVSDSTNALSEDVFVKLIKKVGSQSGVILNWTLSILGGSILLITSTSYNRPKERKYRLFYLIFFPAWLFGGISIYLATSVSRKVGIYSEMKAQHLPEAIEKVNSTYNNQLLFFQLTIVCLSLWLFMYLAWWIFSNELEN